MVAETVMVADAVGVSGDTEEVSGVLDAAGADGDDPGVELDGHRDAEPDGKVTVVAGSRGGDTRLLDTVSDARVAVVVRPRDADGGLVIKTPPAVPVGGADGDEAAAAVTDTEIEELLPDDGADDALEATAMVVGNDGRGTVASEQSP